ncbi:hypothetical protein OCGS_1277 [Oceaniovalibus guishaninsula JLT2003]|uniref:Medium/long-chain acyl-CoA thioesterase YigI n=1 Tax=Oceaniovalibus guishaninsula JLT2003 TaxID=1231392 RepID=K2HNJ3_9RHOB|nr:PaaI family thioesterase [Oceaniovalibus guishaninsula]EKE44439.1 hypothetical protein OCGS_1277 [Oceaniovalibus guishaninsula JLT2003]
MTPEKRAQIRDSFARQGLMATLGATLDDLEPGQATIAAPITDRSSQQHGFAHAGLVFAIGDSAAGYAAMTLTGPAAEVLTAEMKINLLRPSQGESLIAFGRVLKPGRRLIVVVSEVWALTGGDRVHVAQLQGTIVPV